MRPKTRTHARIATLTLGLAAAIAPAIHAATAAAAADAPAAGEVTFTRDVLPILQENCQTCHRHGGDNYTGMVAPMSLLTYDEVRPWARSIAKNVGARTMPPWFAAPEFHGVFSNERTLTDAEIATLVRWVESGAPEGAAADAPPARDFDDHEGWRIGEPDLVVTAPRYFVPDDVDTHYADHRVTLTPDILPESRFIQAIEWRGGSDVVHHIVGYAYMPGTEIDRGSGYGLGSIAPGEEPMRFPPGYAKLLVQGSTIVFNMHYHKEKGPGTGKWDASQVAFKFYPEDADVAHFVDHNAIGNHGFQLPPGAPSWHVGAARVFDQPTTILALHPHMHLRGKRATYTAHYPDGTTEVLLHVPAFDFNWQTDYSFREPKRLPAGTRLEYEAWFDNSTANAANPNPAVVVNPGRETWDEMMLGYVTYAKTDAADLTVEEVLAQHFPKNQADEHSQE
jgi:mono/diheme cytochrome c family protein